MTLLRLIARPLLAAVFVTSGVKSLRNPDPLVPTAKPVTDRVVPSLKKVSPPQVVDRIPEDTKTLVRVNAAVQVVGGLALASGKYRRLGAAALAVSLVPTTLAGHPFWEKDDPDEREAQKVQFFKNLGLGGGLLLASVDTEGKPGLIWRARHGARGARREAKRAAKAARREAKQAQSHTRKASRTARREAAHAGSRTKSVLPRPGH